VPDVETTLPLLARIGFAWVCFFRVLFDGAFARRAFAAQSAVALPPAHELPRQPVTSQPPADERPSPTPALQLLAALQREGRLVDFLEQDIATFSDGDVGAVARVVHEGCRRALRQNMTLVAVRAEDEDAQVEIAAGFNPSEIKLTGNVKGAAPYRGVLRHCGWRVTEVTLPTPLKGYDAEVIAPAEIEL
jgi:hypothetical protein